MNQMGGGSISCSGRKDYYKIDLTMTGKKFLIYRLVSKNKDTISHKLKITKFFDKYGAGAAGDVFGVARNNVLLWKRKLKEGGDNPVALLPSSRKPPKPRRSKRLEIVDYIPQRRWRCPRLFKFPSATTIASTIKHLKKRSFHPEKAGDWRDFLGKLLVEKEFDFNKY